MRKTLFLALAGIFVSGICLADVIKGNIEKVDIKAYEIIVSGRRVDIGKATVFTVNEMGVTKTVIIRDIKDHKDETAVCYGSTRKDDVFDAYKVKIYEGHR